MTECTLGPVDRARRARALRTLAPRRGCIASRLAKFIELRFDLRPLFEARGTRVGVERLSFSISQNINYNFKLIIVSIHVSCAVLDGFEACEGTQP